VLRSGPHLLLLLVWGQRVRMTCKWPHECCVHGEELCSWRSPVCHAAARTRGNLWTWPMLAALAGPNSCAALGSTLTRLLCWCLTHFTPHALPAAFTLPSPPCTHTTPRPPQVRSNLLTVQPFKDVFGPGTKRKKPKLSVDSMAELGVQADERDDKWVVRAGGRGGRGACWVCVRLLCSTARCPCRRVRPSARCCAGQGWGAQLRPFLLSTCLWPLAPAASAVPMRPPASTCLWPLAPAASAVPTRPPALRASPASCAAHVAPCGWPLPTAPLPNPAPPLRFDEAVPELEAEKVRLATCGPQGAAHHSYA